jgi:hypothetical protein
MPLDLQVGQPPPGASIRQASTSNPRVGGSNPPGASGVSKQLFLGHAPLACASFSPKIEPGRVFDRTGSLDEVPDGYRAMNDRGALKS